MIADELVLCQLVYIIPSILLYIIEIYVMFFGIHKSKFNKVSFNQIFFIYAVNNIISEILYYFFFRMNRASLFFGLFEHLLGSQIIVVLLWQLLYHTSLAANFLDLVLSVNRFSSVLRPLQYKTFWIGKIKWIIILMVIFPYICFWTFLFEQMTMIYDEEYKEYYIVAKQSPPIIWPSSSTILGSCFTIACIGCFICNAYVGLILYKRKNNITSFNYQQEKIYFLFMMCIFVNQLLHCCTQWTLDYASYDIYVFIIEYQFIIMDLFNLLPPWALFLMNSTLRKTIHKTLIKNSKQIANRITVKITVATENL